MWKTCRGRLSWKIWVCSPPGSPIHGDSPGKNTRVGCHALLQGIFPTPGSNPGLPHCRWILYHLSHKRSPDLGLLKVSTAMKHRNELVIFWPSLPSGISHRFSLWNVNTIYLWWSLSWRSLPSRQDHLSSPSNEQMLSVYIYVHTYAFTHTFMQ